MPAETRQKIAADDSVRIIERETASVGPTDIQELERRVTSLQNDISQLANLANSVRRQAGDGGFLRLGTPDYFGSLGRFGPVAPGMVPPPPMAGPSTPLFGVGAPVYNVAPDAVTMREFGSRPPVPRQPGVNIVDAGEEYVVQVELPAIKKKDLELLGSERSLTVSAQVRPETEQDGTVILGEVAPTAYRRTIHLPAPCNTTRTRATLKDGILTLNIPKRDPSNGMRRIDVAYG